MATLTRTNTYSQPAEQVSILSQLIKSYSKWADYMTYYRYMIIGILIILQASVIAPLNLILITHYSLNLDVIFVPLVTLTTMAVLVSNIAIIPMRYVLGIFIASLAVNLAILAIHLVYIF